MKRARQFDLAYTDLGVGVTTDGQVTVYATSDAEREAVVLLHFGSPLDAAMALAEWQRQLAPHLPDDNGDAF